MKNPATSILPAIALLLSSCDQAAKHDAPDPQSRLEEKADAAIRRQKELERQLADQQLAAERDALERERARLEHERAESEQREQEARAAAAKSIALREKQLAEKENLLNQMREDLAKRQLELDDLSAELSQREAELAGAEPVNLEPATATTPVAGFDTFYTSLSEYGYWFESSDYGYVWQPAVASDPSWRPYTRGRWACTEYGWTWISDEPFGWATYHYGRWALLHGYGWVWVPGTTWAPSWVTWRYSDDYVGWAPLPPETLAYGTVTWGSSVEIMFGIGSTWFTFVRTTHFGYPIHTHCLPYRNNHIYIGRSVNVTNIRIGHGHVFCGGPRHKDFLRPGHRPVPYYHLKPGHAPANSPLARKPRIHDRTLHVYAPSLDRLNHTGQKPRHVRGRIDSPRIDRAKPLAPEITKRFRETIAPGRGKAEQRPSRETTPSTRPAPTVSSPTPKPPASAKPPTKPLQTKPVQTARQARLREQGRLSPNSKATQTPTIRQTTPSLPKVVTPPKIKVTPSRANPVPQTTIPRTHTVAPGRTTSVPSAVRPPSVKPAPATPSRATAPRTAPPQRTTAAPTRIAPRSGPRQGPDPATRPSAETRSTTKRLPTAPIIVLVHPALLRQRLDPALFRQRLLSLILPIVERKLVPLVPNRLPALPLNRPPHPRPSPTDHEKTARDSSRAVSFRE